MYSIADRLLIYPENGISFIDQLKDCLKQINQHCGNNVFILQQSFFIALNNNTEFNNFRKKILKVLEDFQANKPATSVIAMPPANGHSVTVELILTTIGIDRHVIYKSYNNIPYTIIESNSYKELYAGGISTYKTTINFTEQAEGAFRILKSILQKEGLGFTDIIRQWNYVENILNVQDESGHVIQHYQILNDVRSKYYAESNFDKGYPAATGIGMNAGGVILDIYAVRSMKNIAIYPLKNPFQIDAYNYSEQMLVGDATVNQQKKTTPKFERAKYIEINNKANIYISGTASINSELTVGINDPVKQTETTLKNIRDLISVKNLHKTGINGIDKKPEYEFIRVYIKYREHFKCVRNICSGRFDNIPVHYLITDICRDNLLVEVEGVATID